MSTNTSVTQCATTSAPPLSAWPFAASSNAAGRLTLHDASNGRIAVAPDTNTLVYTKRTPNARKVTQVNAAWNSASFRHETNTPRTPLVTERTATAFTRSPSGMSSTSRVAGSASLASTWNSAVRNTTHFSRNVDAAPATPNALANRL